MDGYTAAESRSGWMDVAVLNTEAPPEEVLCTDRLSDT